MARLTRRSARSSKRGQPLRSRVWDNFYLFTVPSTLQGVSVPPDEVWNIPIYADRELFHREYGASPTIMRMIQYWTARMVSGDLLEEVTGFIGWSVRDWEYGPGLVNGQWFTTWTEFTANEDGRQDYLYSSYFSLGTPVGVSTSFIANQVLENGSDLRGKRIIRDDEMLYCTIGNSADSTVDMWFEVQNKILLYGSTG